MATPALLEAPGLPPFTKRSRIASGLALAIVAPLLLGYVLPAERVLELVAEKRRRAPPVRLLVEVERTDAEEPFRGWVELHPGGGWRISNEEGQVWTGQGPRIRRVLGPPPPVGLEQIWLLVISDEARLLAYAISMGIDVTRNDLARCGDADCFVLGGRGARVQLWVDKDRFQVRKYRNPQGLYLHFEGYQEVGGPLHLPERIRVTDELEPVLEVGILEAEPAPELRGDADLRPPGGGGSPARRHDVHSHSTQ